MYFEGKSFRAAEKTSGLTLAEDEEEKEEKVERNGGSTSSRGKSRERESRVAG